MSEHTSDSHRSSPSRPSVARCVTLLAERIRSGDWSCGTRLPSIASLAAWCGASRVSVWRALRVLSVQGVVSIVPGRGTFVGAPPQPPLLPRAGAARSRWARLAQRLEHDLLTGVLPTGRMLPSTKELASNHGLDPRTVRRAITELENRGLLRRSRGAYYASGAPRHGGAALLFLTTQSLREFSSTAFASLRMSAFVRSLERACGERNIRFMPLAATDRDMLRQAHATRSVLGHIVYCPGDRGPDVLESTAPFRKPTCVFEYPYRMGPALSLKRLEACGATLFHIDDHRAGAEIGRFVLGLAGDRQVSFISPFHAERFSRERLDGLMETYASAGRKYDIISHTTERNKRDIYRAFLRCSANGPFGPAEKPAAAGVHRNRSVAVLDEHFGPGEMDWLTGTPVWEAQFERLYANALWDELTPLFESATQTGWPAAWVCVSDTVAIAALRYLRRAGVKVGEQCVVVGFDNSYEATYHGLSSYDFDTISIGSRMLEHVVRPLQVGRIVACEGSMVER